MTGLGYHKAQPDHCVFMKRYAEGDFIILLLYVDDMLIAAKSMSEINELKKQLSNEFEMKDLDAAKKILGMEISRDRPSGKSISKSERIN